MHQLIIIAHGSRRQESNDEILALVEHVRSQAGDRYDAIACAYLELAKPSSEDAIANAVAGGAEHITLLPYFLTDGNHVAHDIPAIRDRCTQLYPEVPIDLKPYLGQSPAIADLLLQLSME